MLTPPPSGSSHAGPSVERRPIKRARAVRVCTRCKVQKLKCDREEPCSSCTRASLGHRCVYKAWSNGPPDTSIDLAQRVAQLEAELNQLRATSSDSSLPTPRRTSESFAALTLPANTLAASHTSHTSYTPITSFQQLAKQLPPLETCHKYLDHFAKFDVNYRTTHIPSFRRRADSLLARLPSISTDDASLIALILIAMAIGAERDSCLDLSTTTHDAPLLDRLYANAIDLIETSGGEYIDLDYVLAVYLRSVRFKHGNNASPAVTWIAVGKAIAAARWLRLDHVEEAVWSFEVEMRKRLWCQITTSERLLMDLLRLPGPACPPLTPAQIPLIIDDSVLETGDMGSSGVAEWSYVAIKMRYAQITAKITAILPADNIPPSLEQLEAAHRLLLDFESTFDPHFRIDRTPTFDEPPWALGQGCVLITGVMHATILLFEKGFKSPDSTVRSACLKGALQAAERLIRTFQLLYAHVLFKWPDGRPLNIWSFGGKMFAAAMAVASALVVEPGVNTLERKNTFAEAIRNLELMTAESTRCTMNDRSLALLRKVKTKLDNGENPFVGDIGSERDPFSGEKLDERAVEWTGISHEEWLDWSQWSTMFPGLFSGETLDV